MENNINQEQYANPYSMKWHKFLIYFSLWASAVINLLNAFQYFTGSIYGANGEASMVYSYYDGIKAVDMLMAVCLIAVAVYSIVTRFALAGYKAKGPKLLFGLYIVNAVVAIAYIFIASSVTGIAIIDLIDSNTISSLISSIAMAFINKTYYDKRAAAFNQ